MAEALFAHGGPPPAERLDWLERDLADCFGHVTLRARLLFRACVATLTWVAPLLVARLPAASARQDAEPHAPDDAPESSDGQVRVGDVVPRRSPAYAGGPAEVSPILARK